jgi:WD40 repeat protein
MNDVQPDSGKQGDKNGSKQEVAKKIPLVSNGSSIVLANEHLGEIVHSKWNPSKKILATGGNGDCFVDLWDLTQPNSGVLKPMKQLRHISVVNTNDTQPERGDENHYISSIQWSNNGDKLLTSAYDNIARVWNLEGKLQGLLSAQSSLIMSCWNKSDTLVASGGDETNVLVWNPNSI